MDAALKIKKRIDEKVTSSLPPISTNWSKASRQNATHQKQQELEAGRSRESFKRFHLDQMFSSRNSAGASSPLCSTMPSKQTRIVAKTKKKENLKENDDLRVKECSDKNVEEDVKSDYEIDFEDEKVGF